MTEKLDAHCERDPQPVELDRTDVPAALAEVVARMMEKDPAARFQTPAEVELAIESFLRSEFIEAEEQPECHSQNNAQRVAGVESRGTSGKPPGNYNRAFHRNRPERQRVP